MKEPNWKTCSEEELWEFVSFHLSKQGIQTVLVGGAVVSIYSKGLYRSGDLDLVVQSFQFDFNKLKEILNNLGFVKHSSRNYYNHPECMHIFLEFLPPPVAIGEDYNIKPDERNIKGTIIKILQPTDCIKDRLASYIYFDAKECLDQAILVAKSQPFDLELVKKWCDKEGGNALAAFETFNKSLN